ncbi:hypothetical protein LYNGBM3L_22290 [Moorena producens 3L]|uniref:Uncharacterized protein n=2 Tax=Coleofasciculaceae TaxID=1892251 RepID=F4XMJ5_9CYAN|nr:hypothetical protein LYNGBM3L_22290 [Moorena producens 3L]
MVLLELLSAISYQPISDQDQGVILKGGIDIFVLKG